MEERRGPDPIISPTIAPTNTAPIPSSTAQNISVTTLSLFVLFSSVIHLPSSTVVEQRDSPYGMTPRLDKQEEGNETQSPQDPIPIVKEEWRRPTDQRQEHDKLHDHRHQSHNVWRKREWKELESPCAWRPPQQCKEGKRGRIRSGRVGGVLKEKSS